ncbi:MAG: hypothetical protein AAF542_24500 [Pseudomonadota bacterium]
MSRISLFGLPSFLCYGYLSQFEINEASLLQMAVALGVAALLQLVAWYCCWRDNFYPTIPELVFWAIAFRLLGVYGNPILEDDFYRYLWDGYQFVENGVVYSLAPQHWFDSAIATPAFEHVLDSINNPHIATIYGPVCQYVFGLSYLLAPAEAWPLQLIFSVFDVGIVLLLCTLTNTRNVLLYAWCPLVIKEVAFTAHVDSMAVFFLLAACVAMIKNRRVLVGGALALAVASKIFAILLLPLLLYRRKLSILAFGVTLILLYAPFLSELRANEHGLSAMASGWVFNAPLFLLLPKYFVQLQILTFILFAGIWCFSAWHWRKNGDVLPRADWIYAAFLLAIPALNPWYLIWLLPFAALKPSLTAWTASVAVLFAYVIGLNIQSDDLLAYQQPLWALCLEYGLVLTAFAFDLAKQRRPNVNGGDLKSA